MAMEPPEPVEDAPAPVEPPAPVEDAPTLHEPAPVESAPALDGPMAPALAGPGPDAGPAPPAASAATEARVAELEAVVASLRQALSKAAAAPSTDEGDDSLESLEASMRAAAEKLMGGDASAEATLVARGVAFETLTRTHHTQDRLDAQIRKHPEYVARCAEEEAAWERENAAANAAALEATRHLVPPDVAAAAGERVTRAFEVAAARRGVGAAVARKVAKRVPRAVWSATF